jgi:hypothetical protein
VTAQLIQAGRRWLKTGWRNAANNGHGRCSIIAEDKASLSGERPDLIGWYDKKSILIEVKVSRADFFRDGSKTWRMYGEGMGQIRWYLTPPGLVTWDEVPYSYGLAEFDGTSIVVILEPLFRGNFYDLDAERSLLMALLRAKTSEVTP